MNVHRAIARFAADEMDVAIDVIAAAIDNRLEVGDISQLARILADSGNSLRPRLHSADLASTGGPGSMATVLVPLQMRARGLVVPKIGVPGRPAGAVDILGSIPGYRVDLSANEAERCLDRSGYVHVMAGRAFAPLDLLLFRLRQQWPGGQAAPSLVVASLLSKKLAAGSPLAGLQIRTAPFGNFGVDVATSVINEALFRAVASDLGLTPVVFHADSSQPSQPWIGRGEQLVALREVIYGDPSKPLIAHALECDRMAAALAEHAGLSAQTPTRDAVAVAFEANLIAQGASPGAFDSRVRAVLQAPRTLVRAQATGIVRVDMENLRTTLVEAQAREGEPFADPAGVQLLALPGEFVVAGQELASIRCEPSAILSALMRCVSTADLHHGDGSDG